MNLVAEEIKELIASADTRKAIQTVLSEFTPLLEIGNNGRREAIANGHSKETHSLPSPRNNPPQNMD